MWSRRVPLLTRLNFFFCFTHLLIHCDLALCKEILWNNSFLITTLREASC